jgi:hypothetical protein
MVSLSQDMNDKKMKKLQKPKQPSYKVAASNEFADIPPSEQKALHARIKDEMSSASPPVQNKVAMTASLVTVITQAIHTDDQQMLNDILKEGCQPIQIETTVRRLEPGVALDLLHKCTEIFQKEPTRAQEVLSWIKEVVKTHATFLVSQPNIAVYLAPVQHVIKEHLANFDKLLMLQGRLELLLGRLPTHGMATTDPVPLSAFVEENGELHIAGRVRAKSALESLGVVGNEGSDGEPDEDAMKQMTLDTIGEDDDEEDEEEEADDDMDEDDDERLF